MAYVTSTSSESSQLHAFSIHSWLFNSEILEIRSTGSRKKGWTDASPSPTYFLRNSFCLFSTIKPKEHHNDGAACCYSGMDMMNQSAPPSVVQANVGRNVTPHSPSSGLFLYHFLHTLVLWRHESIHNNTNNQQTPPPWWWSRSPLQWCVFNDTTLSE